MYFDNKPFVGYFMMMECADGCSITALSIQTKHWLLVVFVFCLPLIAEMEITTLYFQIKSFSLVIYLIEDYWIMVKKVSRDIPANSELILHMACCIFKAPKHPRV